MLIHKAVSAICKDLAGWWHRRNFSGMCLSVRPSPWAYRVQYADYRSCWVVEMLICSGRMTPPGTHLGCHSAAVFKSRF